VAEVAVKFAVAARTAVVTILCDGVAAREDDAASLAVVGLKRRPLAWRFEDAARTAEATALKLGFATREPDAARIAVAFHAIVDEDGKP
jgi:hypothetical protein